MPMKKFINQSEDLTREVLEGLELANSDLLRVTDSNLVINKKLEEAERVTIVTLGGAGHEPALSGFVGDGMVDIAVVGDVFAAPGPNSCLEAIKMADRGKGVLFVVLNHAGDMLTGNLVMKQVKKEGLNVKKVVTQEDIANAPRENSDDRRGLVGCIPLYKIAAGAAKEGKSLDEVAEIAQKFADNMATIAVACKGATHPSTGMVISELGENEMEIGMGQHGEGGGGRMEMKSADETAEIMTQALIKDLDIKDGEKVMLIVNGSGATTLMEMLIVYRKCHKILQEKNIEVLSNHVGELLTTQETAGFQLFIARMNEELLRYFNSPCNTPYFKKN
ncbi:glycerol kinase [Clostridioides difficile]|uniref:dihydroxyacetone kinase subunit DhaK n=1 Tax=unclassified Clostridioides TaxID=2635829 RepID=UPI001431E539|nr:dihydroxyacetone kinase subunit DhaK [Clostridioides difficile]MDB3084572.1 glycerol kinase [Clostridioides difficile]NJI81646.1 dihydroxyacetone kinase subunit DhaK [Clostridioides difficile]NJJ35920.1 dihydroxyacetone kinase subunit DhaK [Clostridioides difficile]NJK15692.1 dihydroxyacetone kinase subunit DhaK [Clostridioides difficile]